ncbi:SE1832 family protein [Bacillus piscicola]|uniref:SE1832 family protein n=1 Tax=Bacillus piscicola TaxID=1632684 RepID=UPI001F08978B|nr:SE1832 family protein [Bacillus piscicola]
MERSKIEEELTMLKADYVRLQGDVEKLETVGGDASPALKQLETIEEEIKNLKAKLREHH